MKISLARPHDIRSWSFGEVKKPETINYRTYRPEKDGLFCERIFGPEKDWECACGKYRGMKYKGMICDRCGVKVTHSRVRRKRMGHIELAAPVVHIWFFKAMPSRLGNLLDMKTTSLEKVIYFQDYVVIDPGDTPLKKQQLLTEEEYRTAREQYGEGTFEADMGAEAVRKLLQELDLVQLSKDLRNELAETGSKQKAKDLINRLKIVESDPRQRQQARVDGAGRDPGHPARPAAAGAARFGQLRHERSERPLPPHHQPQQPAQEAGRPERAGSHHPQRKADAAAVGRRAVRQQPLQAARCSARSNRPLKSLTDMIKGKQGRFRENLLGKRVDYSARSVIVVGPDLRLHQCGLPKKIALELFQPFIIRRLKELGHADTIKSAKKMLERKDDEVWDILEEVIRNHPVLLNRAPTLHRMGIQAFEPMLVEGNAIKLHPLVCKGFNADFDGDQMAVHLPLSIEAQVEAHTLMMSTNNIFSPANGAPIISPSQDVVMGCYYVTMSLPGRKGEGMIFASLNEVQLAYSLGAVDTHARIKVKLPPHAPARRAKATTAKPGAIIDTTVGRVMFNMTLPDGMPFYNIPMRSSELAKVISDCYQILGRRATIDLLDDMKQLGFRQSTRSGLSFATDDLITPPTARRKIIGDAEKSVLKMQQALSARHHHRGRALQPGARRLDARSRADHDRDDDRAGERLSPAGLRQPDLPDGALRCPRRRRTDSPAGRHARFDGQAVGQDHRDADQGQLPRRPVGARVLQLDARCPQGSGRYGPQDGRLGLPHPQAGRRGAERGHHDGRLRHDAGHHQGRHLPRREGRSPPGRLDPRPRQPDQHRQPDHRRSDRPRKRDDHARRSPADRRAGPGKDPGPQPDDLRSHARHLPPLLRHGPVDRLAWSKKAWPSASSPPRASASRARSSRCVRSTSAASAARDVEESEIKAKKGGIVQVHPARRSSRTTPASRSCSPATAKS